MNAAKIIAQKRDGEALSDSQIASFIGGYARGEVPDYQMSALAMAIFLRGMTAEETTSLTRCMLESGDKLRWPDRDLPIVDKHSTGGVGDKISLILAPLLACCDLRIPMISGRGLGATGGTLDKLESIAGFRTQLSIEEIVDITRNLGCVIAGATEQIAPADRKLYALRDVTGTVASIPLITASILSKKLAEDPDVLVLDVKYGSGAFMKTESLARQLAESLVATGKQLGVATTALLTDMNQPLGRLVGNALEVNESIDALQGRGPADVMSLTIELGAEALRSSGGTADRAEGRARLQELLTSGAAFAKFEEMVRAQGGNLQAKREIAPPRTVPAPAGGIVQAVDNERLGWSVIDLGGGRRQLGDQIDHAVGLEIHVRIGDTVERGQPLATVFSRGEAGDVGESVASAFTIADQQVDSPPLILEFITDE